MLQDGGDESRQRAGGERRRRLRPARVAAHRGAESAELVVWNDVSGQ